ncbi:MAG: hypothetical protein AB7P20_09685 [Rhizobiaceae bacterium]
MPQHLEYTALLCGILFVVGGLGSVLVNRSFYNVGILATCIGFGVMLAVFGNRASGSFKNWAVAGAGAMAIILYFVLRQYPILDTRYARGQILDAESVQSIAGRGSHSFLVGRESASAFKFVVFPEEIDGDVFRLSFVTNPIPGGPTSGSEFRIDCIEAEHLRHAMESGKMLSFELERREREGRVEYRLRLAGGGGYVGRLNQGDCGEDAPAPDVGGNGIAGLSLVTPAYAQGLEIGAVPKLSPGLESEDQQLREYTRDELAKLRDPAGFKLLTDGWNVETSSYRADLGRLVIWERAIRAEPATAVPIAQSMNRRQMSYLVQMTGQGDYTLRRAAVEVLQRLIETTSWPGGPTADVSANMLAAVTEIYMTPMRPPLVKREISFDKGNMIYNTTMAVQFVQCNMSTKFREAIVTAIDSFLRDPDPDLGKVTVLANSVRERLRRCP